MAPSVRTAASACLLLALASCASSALAPEPVSSPASARRNVLWVCLEDMNPWLGCYGEALVPTPHFDALAARGVRFERAYMPGAVCSATRSALLLGAMQTTLGVHNHRSARAEFRGQDMGADYDAIRLPDGVRPLPELLRAAGYYTFNQGKTDYNFVWREADLYDGLDERMETAAADFARFVDAARAAGKPFFGQVQLRGGKHPARRLVDAARVSVPPYYPDVPLVREQIAKHHDCVREADAELGAIVAALRARDLLDSTVVVLFSDHGCEMHRHKQFLYEGGIRVPLIVAGPGLPRGAVRADLASGIDLAATSLAVAGVPAPAHMEGGDLFAPQRPPREFVVAARDRCDYSIDRIRAVVTEHYAYLRNGLTDRPYMQPQYRDPWPVTQELRRMAKSGELDAVQMRFYGDARPAEELYDLRADPHQIADLSGDPAHAGVLARHRALLDGWIAATGDQGQRAESAAGLRCVLERWGELCVNPEFAPIRRAMQREADGRRHVLVLGDSISIGYTPAVKELLAARADVVRPAENCAGTNHGVQRIDEWLQLDGGGWDVVHFNFGLHDLKRVDAATGRNSNDPASPRQAEPERYEQQLREIVQKLRATGARLLFATTTPVPAGRVRPHRDPADVERYNAIARRVMGEHGIAIDDLFGFAHERLSRIQKPADVHFTADGSRELAEQVARSIAVELDALARAGR